MQSILVDFDVWKAITLRRPDVATSENDVLREMFGLPRTSSSGTSAAAMSDRKTWRTEGVDVPVGTMIRHRFRGGQIATATIDADGVNFDGKLYKGFSPAASAASGGSSVNGWQFWEYRGAGGDWCKVDQLRK